VLVDSLREISRSAFGQTHRLELMIAIADSDDGVVSLTELARALGVSISSLQRPFESVIATKLISPLPDVDSRYRYYTRNPSSAWAWAKELSLMAHPI
jgi:DNA-binding IclR family transcriptional regulator